MSRDWVRLGVVNYWRPTSRWTPRVAALAIAPIITASSAARAQVPTVLTARVDFANSVRDMMDLEQEHFVGVATLRITVPGNATLEWSGDAHYATVSVPHDGASSPPPPHAPHSELRSDRWIGSWRAVGRGIEVRFVRSEAFDPALAVDVAWRCDPTRVTVDGQDIEAFRCRSEQTMTLPQGAAHHLPAYLQVPIHLATPATQLVEIVVARSGADRRVEPSFATFHLAPRFVPVMPSAPNGMSAGCPSDWAHREADATGFACRDEERGAFCNGSARRDSSRPLPAVVTETRASIVARGFTVQREGQDGELHYFVYDDSAGHRIVHFARAVSGARRIEVVCGSESASTSAQIATFVEIARSAR